MQAREMVLVFQADKPDEGRDLMAFARAWQDESGEDKRGEQWSLTLLALGPGQEEELLSVAGQAGIDVNWLFSASDQAWERGLEPVVCAALMEEYYRSGPPDLLVMPDRALAQEVIPWLSGSWGVQCLSGVEDIRNNARTGLNLRSSVLGGKAWAWSEVCFPLLLTVLPGAFADFHGRGLQKAGIHKHCLSVDKRSLSPIQVESEPKYFVRAASQAQEEDDQRHRLQGAEVVLAVGGGLGDKENLELMREVLRFFPKAELAGSRLVCDQGWLPYARQVGVSGLVVRPELYVASGISGAPQHIQGMQNSKYVVAINKDPQAAIFNHADLGIVDDLLGFWQDFIQLMTK